MLSLTNMMFVVIILAEKTVKPVATVTVLTAVLQAFILLVRTARVSERIRNLRYRPNLLFGTVFVGIQVLPKQYIWTLR